MLVADGLVLTAAHVVVHEDCIGTVRLRWKSTHEDFNLTSGDRKNGFHDAIETEPGDRGVVWSCSDLDLALISCDQPPDVRPVPIADEEIQEGSEWSAEAYPKTGENIREDSKWMSGECSSIDGSGKASRFQLQGIQAMRSGGASADAHWSGASGAAVTIEIEGQRRVLGVLIQEDVSFETSLTAVPLLEACQDESFRSRVFAESEDDGSWEGFEASHDALKAWQAAYLKKIEQILGRISELAWGRLTTECPTLGAYPSEERQKADMAKRLLDPSHYDLQDALVTVVNSLNQDDQAREADLVRDLLFTIAPGTTRPESRQFIAWMRDKKGRISLGAVAGTPTKADVLAAGIDAGQVELVPRRADADLPAGTARIPYPPRVGFDPDGEAYIEAICEFLNGQLEPGKIADDVEKFLIQTQAKGAQISLDRLRRSLQRRAKHHKERSFYLTVPAATMLNEHQRERLLKALSTLMERVQEIRILAIDTAWIDDDDEEFGALAYTVPVRRGLGGIT